jgi:hypothetical protein
MIKISYLLKNHPSDSMIHENYSMETCLSAFWILLNIREYIAKKINGLLNLHQAAALRSFLVKHFVFIFK